jgi:O-antigen/teichoic acid export membrane protein
MGNVFLAVGRTGFMFLNALLNLILIGIFIYPMVTWGGIFGVAGLYSMVWVITLIVLIVWLDKLVGIKFKEIFTQLKFPLMGSLIAMLPVKYLLGAAISLSNLLTFIPAIILVVIIYLYVISRLDQEAGESIKRCWREKKLVLI